MSYKWTFVASSLLFKNSNVVLIYSNAYSYCHVNAYQRVQRKVCISCYSIMMSLLSEVLAFLFQRARKKTMMPLSLAQQHSNNWKPQTATDIQLGNPLKTTADHESNVTNLAGNKFPKCHHHITTKHRTFYSQTLYENHDLIVCCKLSIFPAIVTTNPVATR